MGSQAKLDEFERVIHRNHTESQIIELLCVMRNEMKQITANQKRLEAEMKLDRSRISFTLKEAAQATGYSYHTLYNMAQTGKMVVSQDGKKGMMIVKREELIRIIDEMELKPKLTVHT